MTVDGREEWCDRLAENEDAQKGGKDEVVEKMGEMWEQNGK